MNSPEIGRERPPEPGDVAYVGAIEHVRARLASASGERFWSELEALAETPELRELLRREFPSQAPLLAAGVERREFLRLMGASLGALGFAACTRQPEETIVPFARSPEFVVPGKPLYFASALALEGTALGVLVESHMGRPTKVEGNPDHPASLGATDAFAQAAILSLYDPDRSHSCLRAGEIGTWSAFTSELAARMDGIAAHEGEGLGVLHAGESSPSVTAELERLKQRFPQANVYRWSAIHRDNERAGAELAFGRDVATHYAFDRAKVVLALEADFLASGPGGVRHARDFATGRRGRVATERMNRLYVVESSFTTTGAMADERLTLRPSELEAFARTVARELGLQVKAPPLPVAEPTWLHKESALGALFIYDNRFAAAIARDLAAHGHESLVIAGREADPIVHALAHAMNAFLESVGTTVEHTEPLEPLAESATDSLRRLADDARAGRIDTLVVLGGNPVYDAPADLAFGEAFAKVPFRVHLSGDVNETSALSHWHVPEAHALESWGDARAHDGTVSIVQPLIAPLHGEHGGGGKSALELLALLLGESGKTPHEIVRAHWSERSGLEGDAFERFWRESLHDGVVAGTTLPALDVEPRGDERQRALFGNQVTRPKSDDDIELALRADASVFDGRFANNAWLQELPRPITRLVWDNAALLSPRTARALDLSSGDVVEIACGERRQRAPVWIVPGHGEAVVTLHLGYGRTRAGKLGTRVGVDAYRLRTSDASWRAGGVRLTKTGERRLLVTVQKHPDQEGRPLARVATFDRFRADPAHVFASAHGAHDELQPPSLYPGFRYDGHAWGMVIDLNACVGCNACMIACQAENNIPVVGKDQVANGREMHWIRIDRYFEDSPAHARGSTLSVTKPVRVLHQPVPCMHCENAPCEVVCPVGATVHSDEGLNEMVYNRCVGTRYCSNNCPYKVRRFNFFPYADYETESLKLGRNPDVTVRSRGVMEKCTYCVQRISQARIQAAKEERPIREGDIVTACQAVCPTQAIVFGDVNDPTSAVSKLRVEPHHYGLLAELGTRPRTTYLAKLANPNPELA